MSGLLGPDGKPISSAALVNKKAPAPSTGPSYGRFSGPDAEFFNLPGGGALQIDLNQLTLNDFRQMKDHYQINNSLTILTFLLHEMEWKIELDGPKAQRDFYTEQMENIWTPLVRSLSQAFWSGYSPNAIEYENDIPARKVVINKIKDLVPEDCLVRWKRVDGNEDLKLNIYNGINQWGAPPIPVESSFWYPLLMENGNYYGRKLLRSAFQPWFFSILMHLFANRYYERFGEPTPVGRASYEDDIRFGGEDMKGNEAMALILQNLRSRGVVILPNDKTPVGANDNTPDFDYSIEYLESQMRGADFERYMTRLDEEMSLALFTPILLMRTADVGSYNLGTQHSVIYQWMLNAIGGDWKQYINLYLLRPLRNFNFGTNAPMPRIKFKRMGAQNQDIINNIVAAQIAKGKLKPNTEELGEMAGLTLTEVQEVTAPAPTPGTDPNADPATPDAGTAGANRLVAVADALCDRIGTQVQAAYRRNDLRDVTFDLGFQRKFEDALRMMGFAYATDLTKEFYQKLDGALHVLQFVGYESAEDFNKAVRASVTGEVSKLSEWM